MNVCATHGKTEYSITVFDDGSTDGTAAQVGELFPEVAILAGDGNAYWARAMATAEASVLARNDVDETDYIVWLNDDVQLDPDAFLRLVPRLSERPEGIVVGAVRDRGSGDLTYSGLQRSGRHPLSFSRVQPLSDSMSAVDTFNGNLVAVPVHIARSMGGIDGSFSHAFADIDYGLRATRQSVSVWLAPDTYGTCSRNPVSPKGKLIDDWRRFTGPKGGGNLQSIVHILRKIVPRSWPIYVATTYALWWYREIVARYSFRFAKLFARNVKASSRS